MKIKRAQHLGFCFGVRDAVSRAFEQATQGPFSILGPLVHNPEIIARLEAVGAHMIPSDSFSPTASVMITAHGTSEKTLAALRQKGLTVWEATCPLVRFAHHRLRSLVEKGYHPVVIGVRGHVEVNGLIGDWEGADVIEREDDIEKLPPRTALGLIAQTTQPIDRVRRLVRIVRRTFPKTRVKFIDTVCRPTKDRQTAARRLARTSDVVVVVGGFNSNNTKELTLTCRQLCHRVHAVEGPQQVDPGWFSPDDQVGLTAGTSVPEDVIVNVESRLRQIAAMIKPTRACRSLRSSSPAENQSTLPENEREIEFHGSLSANRPVCPTARTTTGGTHETR